AVRARDPEPEPTHKPRGQAAAVATRPVSRTVETPAPPPKPERTTRVSAVSTPSTSTRSVDASVMEPESHPAPVVTPPPPSPPPPPPPPPQPPASTTVAAVVPAPAVASAVAPQVVAPSALDANRISGEKTIAPDETTMGAIGRSGTEKLISTYKVCITAEGGINSVTQLRSTGFPAYDDKIQSTIRRDWRFPRFP